MIRLLSIAAVLVLAAATSAQAQVNKPIRSGTFYEDRASNQNIAGTAVTLTFAQTPADKFVNFTRVGCRINVGAQALSQVDIVLGTTSGNSDTGRIFVVDFPPDSAASQTGYKLYTINTQIYVKVGPARYPSLNIYTTAPTSGSGVVGAYCVLTGDLSDN